MKLIVAHLLYISFDQFARFYYEARQLLVRIDTPVGKRRFSLFCHHFASCETINFTDLKFIWRALLMKLASFI